MLELIVLITLKVILILSIILMIFIQIVALKRSKNELNKKGFIKGFFIGFITDFGDTLGIGSFSTSTALFKMTHFLKDDRKLPGTLNAAHAIPVFLEALIFLNAVKISLATLIPMTTAAIIGAFLGTKITVKWNQRKMQFWLAIALAISALFMVIRTYYNIKNGILPSPVHGLYGWKLLIGVIVNITLGILMTIGLGNYTPELIFFSLMGINPIVAYPVMMMDAAMIMLTSAISFIKNNRVEWNGLPGISIGGVLGVIIAATFITRINLNMLSFFIVIIALITSFNLYKESKKELL